MSYALKSLLRRVKDGYPLKGLNHWLCLLSGVNVNVNVFLSGSGCACLGDRDDIIVLQTSRLRGSGGEGGMEENWVQATSLQLLRVTG